MWILPIGKYLQTIPLRRGWTVLGCFADGKTPASAGQSRHRGSSFLESGGPLLWGRSERCWMSGPAAGWWPQLHCRDSPGLLEKGTVDSIDVEVTSKFLPIVLDLNSSDWVGFMHAHTHTHTRIHTPLTMYNYSWHTPTHMFYVA